MFFFFNDTATTEIYTLSLHDALPIYIDALQLRNLAPDELSPFTNFSLTGARQTFTTERGLNVAAPDSRPMSFEPRSEEHTSELQSRQYLVCRLLLEKKKTHSPPAST